MRFLDVKTDYAFKRVFGAQESVPILISFLNAVLEYEDEHRIESLKIIDPYQAPKLAGMKDTFVDVKAKLFNKKNIIIEMQVVHSKNIEQRILYNAAKQYANQLQRGEDYHLLNPVIALTLVDFTLFDEIESYLSRFQLIEKETLVKYTDDVELVFIELPKFTKTEPELLTIEDKWLYFIKHAADLSAIPQSLNEPCIVDAFSRINEAALTPDELELQQKRHAFIQIQRTGLELAEEKGEARGIGIGIEMGIEKGREEGREEGELKAKQEIAQGMLSKKLDIDLIVQLTGLTLEQVSALRSW
jgi:predicted transposase/invertase (TIGR01784 family)